MAAVLADLALWEEQMLRPIVAVVAAGQAAMVVAV